MILTYISLLISDVKHFLCVLLGNLFFSYWETSNKMISPFLTVLFEGLLKFLVPYMFWTLTFVRWIFENIYFYAVACLFTSVIIFFALEACYFDIIPFAYFCSCYLHFCSLIQKNVCMYQYFEMLSLCLLITVLFLF